MTHTYYTSVQNIPRSYELKSARSTSPADQTLGKQRRTDEFLCRTQNEQQPRCSPRSCWK